MNGVGGVVLVAYKLSSLTGTEKLCTFFKAILLLSLFRGPNHCRRRMVEFFRIMRHGIQTSGHFCNFVSPRFTFMTFITFITFQVFSEILEILKILQYFFALFALFVLMR